MEPRQATQFRLGCTPAQWEGQDLALSVNSPPCLLLKTFSESSRGYFMLVLAAVILRVQMLPVSSEAAVSTSHQGVFCSPKYTLCDLACTHPPGDSKHFPNTKLSRQVQCPQLFRADLLAAALVNFLHLAFAWGSRAKAVKWCQSNMGPSSASSLEQLNDTRENKAGGLQGRFGLDPAVSSRQADSIHPELSDFPRLPMLCSEQDQDFGSHLQEPK